MAQIMVRQLRPVGNSTKTSTYRSAVGGGKHRFSGDRGFDVLGVAGEFAGLGDVYTLGRPGSPRSDVLRTAFSCLFVDGRHCQSLGNRAVDVPVECQADVTSANLQYMARFLRSWSGGTSSDRHARRKLIRIAADVVVAAVAMAAFGAAVPARPTLT